MARIGLKERTVYAINPLPDVTSEEVIDRAGVKDWREPSETQHPFVIRWRHGGTGERESGQLLPGATMPLRDNAREARHFGTVYRDVGLVIVEDPNDEKEVRTKSLPALRLMRQFFESRGSRMARDILRGRKISKDSWEDYRGDYAEYYIGQAKADFIKERIDELTKVPATPKVFPGKKKDE